MRLLSYSAGGRNSIGVEVGGKIVDLPAGYAALPASAKVETVALPSDMLAFLDAGEPALRGARAVARYFGEALKAGQPVVDQQGVQVVFSRQEVKLNAPLAEPRKIFCLGLNYRDHAEETKSKIPERPIIFSKMATAIVRPDDPILLPRPDIANQIDFEAEFAFVIGKRGKHIPREQAMDYVAGYTILNDVSARDIQFSESQWLRAKSFDTFAPTGPYLVLRDEVADPHALDVKLWLNGELMQSSNTKQLIFGVDFLVWYLSQSFTLLPGDIISTGTPGGVGFFREPKRLLRPGDVVRIEVSGLGVLENRCEMEP